METSALKNSVRILDFIRKDDGKYKEALITELVSQAINIENIYITPFNEELSKNILSKEQNTGIKILIKQYIVELSSASYSMELHNEIISSWKEIISDIYLYGLEKAFEKAELTDYDTYIILASVIYDAHLNYISYLCRSHDIDLLNLCQEVSIDNSIIETDIPIAIRVPDEQKDKNLTSIPSQETTKAEKLIDNLISFGFQELPLISSLSDESIKLLAQKLVEKGIPYSIAMFDHLKFLEYLGNNHFDSNYKRNIEIAKWFGAKDKTGRGVKGNISSLYASSIEDKTRYTAYNHKEQVIKDFQILK